MLKDKKRRIFLYTHTLDPDAAMAAKATQTRGHRHLVRGICMQGSTGILQTRYIMIDRLQAPLNAKDELVQ